MFRSRDPFWDYCEQRGDKLYCNFCGEGFSVEITRFKCHLSREQGNDIKAYHQVPDDVQAMIKTVFFSELLKYHTQHSNIFDGVAMGLLSIAHSHHYLLDYQFGGKYAETTFHWFEWLLFRF
ncbi:hypothetical protein AMTRI_Chr06g195670 [Amborella trichopoda]